MSRSRITTEKDFMAKRIQRLPPIPDAGITANALALALRIPANRLTEIIHGRRAISADTSLRLARFFGTSAQLWMNLQANYDLDAARDALEERIEAEVQPMRKAS
jgi:addiction module HigA family antidote